MVWPFNNNQQQQQAGALGLGATTQQQGYGQHPQFGASQQPAYGQQYAQPQGFQAFAAGATPPLASALGLGWALAFFAGRMVVSVMASFSVEFLTVSVGLYHSCLPIV